MSPRNPVILVGGIDESGYTGFDLFNYNIVSEPSPHEP
jgi:hypothetical protein